MLRLLSPVTAAGPYRNFTGFPFHLNGTIQHFVFNFQHRLKKPGGFVKLFYLLSDQYILHAKADHFIISYPVAFYAAMASRSASSGLK